MNYTPNPANSLLSGRVQAQPVHQAPVTTSSGAPPSGNMQKGSNPFPSSQQPVGMAQKINDDINKSQIPSAVHHQLQQAAQNNNNHTMNSVPQQSIPNHPPGMNRNLNQHQNTFQQPPQHIVMQSLAQGVQRGGIYQQMQQMAFQTQQQYQGPPSQQQVHHTALPSQQNIFQKLPATIPQTIHQMKPAPPQQQPQQQMKPQTPQHSMQYSPPKPIHPQMKTTAKLASPGSQLQSLQKSPTSPPPAGGQQATSPNKNVPSTPPILSPAVSVALAASNAILQPTSGVTVTPVRIPTLTPVAVSSPQVAASIAVPLPSVTVTAQSPIKPPTPAAGIEPVPTKIVEQPKEPSQTAPAQNKPVPKPSVEEKKPVAPEANNKVVAPGSASPTKAVVATPSAVKSTMRLATVTPARQKKPPATTASNKKPPPTPPAASVPKTQAKAVVAPAPVKLVETPKPVAVKKPQAPTPAPPAASPKSNPAPSTSSVQSNSSSASGSATTPKTKRSRVKVEPYQCPTPELALVTKLSTQTANPSKNGNDEKLTIFYK